MEDEIIKRLHDYLNDINTILDKFKGVVGEAKPEKSWIANIPDKGSYPELGINEFYRHGIGIWVNYMDKVVDFDFFDSNNEPEENDENRIVEIDKWFFFEYLKR